MTSLTVSLPIQSSVTGENNPCIISGPLYTNWNCLLAGYLAASLTLLVKRKREKKNPHIISNGGATGADTLGAICLCSIHKLKGLCLHLYATVTMECVFCHSDSIFKKIKRNIAIATQAVIRAKWRPGCPFVCECRRHGKLLPTACVVPRPKKKRNPFLWIVCVC